MGGLELRSGDEAPRRPGRASSLPPGGRAEARLVLFSVLRGVIVTSGSGAVCLGAYTRGRGGPFK